MARKLSWQITVTTAGTAVQGSATAPGWFLIKAAPTNTGKIYIGNDGAGDVSIDTGLTLDAGEYTAMLLENLNMLWFDSSVNGEKAQVLLLEHPRDADVFNLS